MNDRMKTVEMDFSGKDALIRQNHPLIREIRAIPEILFEDVQITKKNDCLSLKELFLKKNMDFYHVDCLVLRKIAENVIHVLQKFSEIPVFPGLFALEDIYVNLGDSGFPVWITHPERFQLLDFEQDYEWYPEDERVFGDMVLFDETTQNMANQRLIYKILIASTKGNAKIPPRISQQDYSNLFYGTLPELWKEWFEKSEYQSLECWEQSIREAISEEELYEKAVQVKTQQKGENDKEKAEDDFPISEDSSEEIVSGNCVTRMICLFVILRINAVNALEMSRLLYEEQDRLENEKNHGRMQLLQGFIFGDGVICQKPLREYPDGFRIQIPQKIREYSGAETLLIGCEQIRDILHDQKGVCRMCIISDGKVENNMMFKECLHRLSLLQNEGLQIRLILSKNCSCDGWNQLEEIIGENQ